jgi:redox-sensitive bicupin YhaK (pirin superfamily)
MIALRRGSERGHFDHGWLKTWHTFSFADYQDPRHQQFRALRVMNEDWVAPGQGFGMHPHRDMEIVTCVLEGALKHVDSMGNGATLRPGEFQRMTAGTGILHSEFNPSETESVHLYQIWLFPSAKGLKPSYEQKAFAAAERMGKFRVVASPTAREGSLLIHQDAAIHLATLEPGQALRQPIQPGRHAWLQVLRGDIRIGAAALAAGDGAAYSEEPEVSLAAAAPAEVMLFDLA